MIYKIHFVFHLWRNVRGMSLRDAWSYTCDPTWSDGDPVEDAESEMSEMHA